MKKSLGTSHKNVKFECSNFLISRSSFGFYAKIQVIYCLKNNEPLEA